VPLARRWQDEPPLQMTNAPSTTFSAEKRGRTTRRLARTAQSSSQTDLKSLNLARYFEGTVEVWTSAGSDDWDSRGRPSRRLLRDSLGSTAACGRLSRL